MSPPCCPCGLKPTEMHAASPVILSTCVQLYPVGRLGVENSPEKPSGPHDRADFFFVFYNHIPQYSMYICSLRLINYGPACSGVQRSGPHGRS